MPDVLESTYPKNYRRITTQTLTTHLKKRLSVEVIGAKRVGISNFLRFFLFHPDLVAARSERELYIYVDLNDLVSLAIFPFWMLLLKRLVDQVEVHVTDLKIRKSVSRLFSESIQLNDQFFTTESVRKVIDLLLNAGFLPTIFLVRFDRLRDVLTDEFFNNLRGLVQASKSKLSFVVTSYRPLSQLASKLTEKTTLSGFLHSIYLTPVTNEDAGIILKKLARQYNFELSSDLFEKLFRLSGGHVHYLLLLAIYESKNRKNQDAEKMLHAAIKDEEINLLSEELFASLTTVEKKILEKLSMQLPLSQTDLEKSNYLLSAGLIKTSPKPKIFSPLFESFILASTQPSTVSDSFTKKEHALFSFLAKHEGSLCEREDVIEAVWPEQLETGVSDWAVDRLVARLRRKLKLQESVYEITTVITRGYKLVKKGKRE
jgi:hypothetical protein